MSIAKDLRTLLLRSGFCNDGVADNDDDDDGITVDGGRIPDV